MVEGAMRIRHEKLDDLARDGVYVALDESSACPYNVRKYSELVKELGLGPGEQMPEEYLDQCSALPIT